MSPFLFVVCVLLGTVLTALGISGMMVTDDLGATRVLGAGVGFLICVFLFGLEKKKD